MKFRVRVSIWAKHGSKAVEKNLNKWSKILFLVPNFQYKFAEIREFDSFCINFDDTILVKKGSLGSRT